MRIGASLRSVAGEGQPQEPAPRHRRTWALILVALILLGALAYEAPSLPGAVKAGADDLSQFLYSLSGQTQVSTTQGLNYTVYSPLIQAGAANVTYPADYTVLSAYVLAMINGARANFSLSPVSQTAGTYAQQHADSMLKYGYFSHNDTQGFKPYMRYTLLGGTGAVEENVAYASSSSQRFTSTSAVEKELKGLEWTMMYNDSICCNDGHMLNILSKLHNEVSIGVAYSSTKLYLVEDFVNYYINLNFTISKSYYVNMTGTPLTQGLSPDAVYITFDNTPVPATPAELNSGPHDYTAGLLLGGVLPPCSFGCQTFATGITVHADVWVFTGTSVSLDFSLSEFIKAYGSGVYTVYLVTGTDTSTAITSISVFVD